MKVLFYVSIIGLAIGFPYPEQEIPYKTPSYRPQPKFQEEHPKFEPRPYAFDYGVRDDYTGANFGHQEDSDGDTIKGSYSVALPDGRIQKVNYIADHYNGFQAEVTYEGEATYPQYKQQKQQYEDLSNIQYQPQAQYSVNRPTYDVNPRYKEPNTLAFKEDLREAV
ncbi:UNVERIFIED_CONTAM: hypothetical protein RMT77_003003 [Armadillidium vulgare]